MHDIEQGRTEALGGQLDDWDKGRDDPYSDHACQNRHCPTGPKGQAHAWLEHQPRLLLPVTHFRVTFTLPAELSAVARRHQQTSDNLLCRASSEA